MSANLSQKRTPISPRVDFYDATYGRFDEPLYREIRRETWGEDIGQNGWITTIEQDRFIERLEIGPNQRVLDIACGSGGPTLRIAERTGAVVVGVDIHADAIEAGRQHAAARGLRDVASFEVVDAGGPLRFESGSFDAVMSVDAINHLPDRPRVLAEWVRVLKPGGRLLFTDPLVVTGPITNEEIAVRSSIGFFLFVAPETDDRMLSSAGLRDIVKEDLSEATARIAAMWHAARQKREVELRRIEGDATFDGQQQFLEVASRVASEGRLSRFAYSARKLH